MDIAKIDPNFASNGVSGEVKWLDARNKPFHIYGVTFDEEENCFVRLPLSVASRVNPGVRSLHDRTAGGRVRFKTTASRIALKCKLEKISTRKVSQSGSQGFSVYENGVFRGVVYPVAEDFGDKSVIEYTDTVNLFEEGEKNIEIYFPLYSGVLGLSVGFYEQCTLSEPDDYKKKTVLYYGSSITQGGCASRAGNDYQSYIERWSNTDYINLGFAGNARGEREMAEYIVSLKPDIVVMDYDYNAPSVEHLEKTHYAFYEILRKGLADAPIIMMSRPNYSTFVKSDEERRRIVRASYKRAVKSGDERVEFVDGKYLFAGKERDNCTLDGTHPNDLGFYRMACRLYSKLKKYL